MDTHRDPGDVKRVLARGATGSPVGSGLPDRSPQVASVAGPVPSFVRVTTAAGFGVMPLAVLFSIGSRLTESWPSRARTLLRAIAWLLVRAAVSIRVEGQSVPGPAVIVSNHPHVIDGVAVSVADVTMRPVARWHRIPLLRIALWIGNSVITTSGTDRPYHPAYAEALAHLQRGGRVWIAPEGRCQPEEVLCPPRTGAVRMAHEAGVAVQVLAVEHAHHPGPALRDWRPWRRPRVVLRWGASLETTGDLSEDNHRMMTAIAEASGMTWVRRDGQANGAPRSRPSPAPARAQYRSGTNDCSWMGGRT